MKKIVSLLISTLVVFSSSLWADGSGEVARATFATEIQDREPVNSLTELDTTVSKVYFFTEFKNFANHTLTHKWMFEDEVMAEVSFDVGGPRWRTFSSKQLMPEWTGDWTVLILDGDTVIGEHHLDYQAMTASN